MQINEEELVDDIKRFVSENVSLSKISDEELAERIDQIVTDRLKDITVLLRQRYQYHSRYIAL